MTDTLKSAVYAIPAEDWDTWFRVGSALKTHLGDAGFELWDGWSRTSHKYNSQRSQSTWNSLQKGRITIGTVYYMAREHGWNHSDYDEPVGPPVMDVEEIQRERRHRKQLAKKAVKQAQRVMDACIVGPHPYLGNKGFPERDVMVYSGAIGNTWHYDVMVLPVRDSKGSLINIQTIAVDGTKRFLYGGVMRAGRMDIGRGKDLFVVDGYATGLSVERCLRELSIDCTVRVAFMASNIPLMATGKALVITDHDRTPEGREYGAGEMYARKSRCRWWQPPDVGTDFNDVEMMIGTYAASELLREFIYKRIEE